MPTPFLDSAVRLIESIFDYQVGDPIFNIMVGVCLLTWVIVARIFMAMFSTKRGIFAAFFAFVLPVSIALVAYAAAELHAVPLVEGDWAPTALPWLGFGLFLLLSIFVIARRILDLSAGVTVFIYIVATAAAIGAYFGTQITMGVIEYGEGQVEQRDKRVKDELDSLL